VERGDDEWEDPLLALFIIRIDPCYEDVPTSNDDQIAL